MNSTKSGVSSFILLHAAAFETRLLDESEWDRVDQTARTASAGLQLETKADSSAS